MQYKIEFNLQQTATLTVAISFWEKKEVKDQVREFFSRSGKLKADEIKRNWYKLTKTVTKQHNNYILPYRLKYELIHYIEEIGVKIYNWYMYIEQENESQNGGKQTAVNYVEKIYWTPHGTVDEIKVLKLFWLNNPNLDVSKVYNLACKYALKNYINDLWQKIPKHVQDNCYNHCVLCSDRHIIQYWMTFRDNNLPEFIDCFETSTFDRRNLNMRSLRYDLNCSPRENMLQLSVHQGYSIAVKYFWGELTKKETNRSVLDCARLSVKCYNNYEYIEGGVGYYKRENFVEICMFLIHQMTVDQKILFFNEPLIAESFLHDTRDVKGEILKMLLYVWPWQDLIVPVFNDMLKYLEHNSRTINMFFDEITWKIMEDHQQGFYVENSKYPGILRTIWNDLPGSTKQKLSQQRSGFYFIRYLIDAWDIDSIKLIFNDPNIVSVRNQYITAGKEGYIQLIKNNQYELLDQLMEETLMSNEEKKNLKQKINIWCDFIKANQFHLADKLLNWQCSTVEEKRFLKSSIDHIELCKSFIKQEQYDLADKFINWQFEAEEEEKNFKIHFANNIFSIVRIYEIWKEGRRNIDKSKKKSDKFLHWLLESESEMARFKKERIISNELEKSIIHHFIEHSLIDIIHDFLFWCSLSLTEIQAIKEEIGHMIGRNVCRHDIPTGYVTDAENFLKWAFSDNDLIKSFVQLFIVSDDGIISCHYFLRDTRSSPFDSSVDALRENTEKFQKFIDFWVKPLDDIDEFRCKFLAYEVNPVFSYDLVYKENRSIFIDLLDNLERNFKNSNKLI